MSPRVQKSDLSRRRLTTGPHQLASRQRAHSVLADTVRKFVARVRAAHLLGQACAGSTSGRRLHAVPGPSGLGSLTPTSVTREVT